MMTSMNATQTLASLYTVESRGPASERCFVTLNPAGEVIFASIVRRDAVASMDFHNGTTDTPWGGGEVQVRPSVPKNAAFSCGWNGYGFYRLTSGQDVAVPQA